MADDDTPQEPGSFNAADPVQVNNAKREAGRREKEDADVIRKLLHTPQGRAWMWRKLIACRAFAPSYAPGVGMSSKDVTYHEGQRGIGLELLAEVMKASKDLYLRMYSEQNPDQKD